jgi:hypothetical protein
MDGLIDGCMAASLYNDWLSCRNARQGNEGRQSILLINCGAH